MGAPVVQDRSRWSLRAAKRHAAHGVMLRGLVAALAAVMLVEGAWAPPVRAAAAPAAPTVAQAEPATPPADELDPADEIVGARTTTSRTYDLGGGRYAVEAFATPVYYQPDDAAAFEPIDLDFALDPSGATARVDRSPVRVAVGEQADGVVTLEHGDLRISLRPFHAATLGQPGGGRTIAGTVPAGSAPGLGAAPAPVVLAEDDVAEDLAAPPPAGDPSTRRHRADLPEVLPGVGMRVFAHADGTSNFLVLAARPTESAWTFAVKAKDLTLLPGTDGALDFTDATGAVVARMPAPYAVDSTPDEATGSGRTTTAAWYTLSELGSQQLVTVSVDPAWLDAAVYPVYVDPSISIPNTGSSANGDVHVNRGNPTFRYGNYQRPDSPYYYEMWLGESPSDSSYWNMDFVQFGLSAYNGTVVDSATLKIRPYHQYYNAPTSTRTWLRRVTSAWTEDINWNEKPSKTDTGMTSADCVEGQTCSFDVTAMVRDWRDGDTADYGFRLDEVDSNGNEKGPTYWKRLIASEQGTSTVPTLVLAYHDPVTVVSPDGGATARTAGRTLSWATESGWGQDMYRVDVSTSSTFATTLVTSGDVAGDASAWAIPASTALTPGTTYYWRVKARRTTSRTPTPTTMWSQCAEGSFAWDPGANLGMQRQHTFESFDLGAGDALGVNVATGNLVLTHPIVDLPIRGGSLPIALAFNSLDTGDVGLGAGWRLNVQRRLEISGSSATFTDADGARHVFTLSGGVHTAPKTIYATLVKTTGTPNVYTLTYRDQRVDVFHELATGTAFLKESKDRFGNTVTFGYTGTTLTSATDPANRQVSFNWTSGVVTITDWANVSGGIVQTSGTGNRTNRIFLSGGGTVSGWADALNTSGTCPALDTDPVPSHVTCLVLSGTGPGSVTKVRKAQTYTTLTAGALGTGSRTIRTEIAYRGTEVAAVKDAGQADGTDGTTFARPAAGLVEVVRQGTPVSTTRYGLAAPTDQYARVTSVKRKLGGAWIERRTAYDATYPVEPASVTDSYVDGARSATAPDEDRTTSYGYVANSMGLVAKIVEPLTATSAEDQWTQYTYNANNDVTQVTVSQGSSTSDVVPLRRVALTCWAAYNATMPADQRTCPAGTGLYPVRTITRYVAGGAVDHDTNIATDSLFDASGQLLRETHHNHDGQGASLPDRVTSWTYDTRGNQISEVRNWTDGTVSIGGTDVTPDPATAAWTDLTTVVGYDTAGNRISTADPRRAIGLVAPPACALAPTDYVTTSTFDALGNERTTTDPTTPPAALPCTPTTPRSTSTEYDELGGARERTDGKGLKSGTAFDAAGRAVATFEDPDGPGATAGYETSETTVDAAGRPSETWDQAQLVSAALGSTTTTYDELGRVTAVTEAKGVAGVESTTTTGHDALDRITSSTVGDGTTTEQVTITAYDLGGRVVAVDDGFTCTTTTYSWDHADTVTTGLSGGTCTKAAGTHWREVAHAVDALGRETSATQSDAWDDAGNGDQSNATTLDALGSVLDASNYTAASQTRTGSTFSVNALGQTYRDERYTTVGGTRTTGSTARTTFDAAGNTVDACFWKAGIPVDVCRNAGSPPPTRRRP